MFLYDQFFGRNGISSSQSNSARMNTYPIEPSPRHCQRWAFGLSQYRPIPASHVQAKPNARYAGHRSRMSALGRRKVNNRN